MIIDGYSLVTIPIIHHIELMDKTGINKTILFRTLIHPENKKNIKEIKGEIRTLNLNTYNQSSCIGRYSADI